VATIDLTVADGTVRAGIAYRANTPGFGNEHGAQPDLCLVWNDFDVDAATMDVVLYFHGFSIPPDPMASLSSFMRWSGLVEHGAPSFTQRARPTLAVIPRGHAAAALPAGTGAWPFTFPAAIAAPDQVIARALAELAAARRARVPAAPAAIAPGRRLLMAHSGGGRAVLDSLPHFATAPTEIYLFDALYQDPRPVLVDWVSAALERHDLTARLWAGHLGTTACHSGELDAALANVLAGQPAEVSQRFRVERITRPKVRHMDVPGTYAPELLQGPAGPRGVA